MDRTESFQPPARSGRQEMGQGRERKGAMVCSVLLLIAFTHGIEINPGFACCDSCWREFQEASLQALLLASQEEQLQEPTHRRGAPSKPRAALKGQVTDEGLETSKWAQNLPGPHTSGPARECQPDCTHSQSPRPHAAHGSRVPVPQRVCPC